MLEQRYVRAKDNPSERTKLVRGCLKFIAGFSILNDTSSRYNTVSVFAIRILNVPRIYMNILNTR